MLNKFWKYITTHKSLFVIGSLGALGGILTLTLIEVLPDPYFKIVMMNVMEGPQNFESAPHPDDGSPPHQYLIVNWDGSLGDKLDSPGNPVSLCTDNRYIAVPFGHSYDHGDFPKTKTHHLAFVDWEIKQDTGMKLPNYLSIGNHDNEDFGKILWNKNASDWPSETYHFDTTFFLLITASLGGVTAYGDILRFTIKAADEV